MRNGSLWSDIVFEKDVIFYEFDFDVTRVCFLPLVSRNFDDSSFHRLVILCICWDTPTAKSSLWQLPIVSTAFKYVNKMQTYSNWFWKKTNLDTINQFVLKPWNIAVLCILLEVMVWIMERCIMVSKLLQFKSRCTVFGNVSFIIIVDTKTYLTF